LNKIEKYEASNSILDIVWLEPDIFMFTVLIENKVNIIDRT
jgi:hypothetical protein